MKMVITVQAYNYIVSFGLIELLNLIWMRDVNVSGMVHLMMNVEEEVWKACICERIP